MKPKSYGEVTTYKMSPEEIEARYGTWGDKAQENGVKMTTQDSGRPRHQKITDSQLRAELEAGRTVREIASDYKMSEKQIRQRIERLE